MPSYLSSRTKGAGRRSTISAAVASGCASMKPRGWKSARRRGVESVCARELGHLAQVAAQQMRPANGGERPRECRGQGLLDLRLLEPDAELAEQEPDEVARLASADAREEGLEVGSPLRRRGGGAEGRQPLRHLGQAETGVAPVREQLGREIPASPWAT